jgi:sigma-E factor negative regulatory protein RseB
MSQVRPILLAAAVLLAPPAFAGDRAHDWLIRISNAARGLNYDGVFVYQHDHQLEALRVVHRNEDGRSRERLVSLNGAPREILRDDRTVHCYLPDENSVVVEHRRADTKSFPTLLPERLAVLDENYVIELGRTARVAGRRAQQVIIRPRDTLRYGYHLWADVDTGLLLKADLLDTKGETIEQFMFTQIAIGNVPETALKPENTGTDLRWHRVSDDTETGSGTVSAWTVANPPKGFRLTMQMARKEPVRNVPVEHLVLSDGLATVSVFIEKAGSSSAMAMQGASHMGAVNAFGRRLGEHQVTVVGEVPQATVALIGNALAARR